MDPNAAASMFENMMAANRYAGDRPPEFLMTHPVTESRVSDASNRARQYPRKMYTENINYQLIRSRVELIIKGSPAEAAKFFQSRLDGKSRFPEADQYGLVLALTKLGNFQRASELLKPLLKASPNQAIYLTAEADIEIGAGRPEAAIALMKNALSISPGSYPLTMTLAEAYLKANQPHRAAALLEEHAKEHTKDPYVWYVLAEAYGLAGDIVGVHKARAEYFLLTGQLDRAKRQLGYALPLVAGDNLSTVQIEEKIKQIDQMKVALGNL
jgi:predicted Zn-dependent protease